MAMILRTFLCAVFLASAALADFSYQQTSRITGGMARLAGMFSKAAREPVRSSVALKGDRMLQRSNDSAQVIDVARETITTIDYDRKTYSVITFAEMAEALKRMAQKTGDAGEMKFKVSVDSTGQTKQIAGLETRQMVIKMEAEAREQPGAVAMTIDLWIASKVPGYDQVADFYRRMAEKLAWTPGAGLAGMMQPQATQGLAEAYKEMSKIDGMPVYQVVKMGATGQAPPSETAEARQPEEKPSVGGALGGALGGRLGRFGGLGRGRKKEEPKQEQAAPPPAAASNDASSALLEMVTELSGFSSSPVDAGQFEVPAGFKQVENEMKRMAR